MSRRFTRPLTGCFQRWYHKRRRFTRPLTGCFQRWYHKRRRFTRPLTGCFQRWYHKRRRFTRPLTGCFQRWYHKRRRFTRPLTGCFRCLHRICFFGFVSPDLDFFTETRLHDANMHLKIPGQPISSQGKTVESAFLYETTSIFK